MLPSSANRLTVLTRLGEDGNFQDVGPAQHFDMCLTFSGTISKHLSVAGLSTCTFMLSMVDQQCGIEIPCPGPPLLCCSSLNHFIPTLFLTVALTTTMLYLFIPGINGFNASISTTCLSELVHAD